MGQKIHPRGFRIGITEEWRSRWYAPKAAFGEFLIEDQKIRKFIDERLNQNPPYAAIAEVEIERTRTDVKVALHTGRPGLVIGPRGAEIEKLREALEDLIDRKVDVRIVEIKSPDTNAQLVAEGIADGLKKRGGFRRVMKQRADAAITAGAKGIKIRSSGRLGGAEMARVETMLRGSIPLHTLQAHIDYGYAIAKTTYGTIGVKVWMYHGRYGEEAPSLGEGMARRPSRGKRG
ncbi:MAG: 30S ribosomal protein S3 [Phycisphaerae bacterium]|nr:MAG: 30S ribosomal protein S3 [Planctomycetota bacterium]KAB2948547.1 MAG: 30S ribosomal protein S3 [Phycisphaerae bacterium]MBE7458779.1 30S ribosomal protein S3 [Planctomycetia bacterium]MCK6465600.1 30S ribosomal protein S3 [Phycisphaerae bacterium]MCL4719476.1 30S ribosomal protein S3 [Phycisphaerae bacterium]